jgi:fatty acid desaturase
MRGTARKRSSDQLDRSAPYTAGYGFTAEARLLLRTTWLKTNLAKSAASAVGDIVSVLVLAALHVAIWGKSPLMAAIMYLPFAILISRQIRGLENLVHEGSHYNWTRRHRLNDVFVNALAAFPVFSRVSAFRADHDDHHHQIGTMDDPCFRRYVGDLKLGSLSRSTATSYVLGTLTRLARYVCGWWLGPSGISGTSLVYGAIWHVLAVLALAIASGPTHAVIIWTLYFAVPFFIVLPPFRFNAEAAKHTYDDNDGTVFSATYSNVGTVHVLLHPHGDQFHLLHHLHPAIPHHRLRAVDRWLMAHDAKYAGGRRRSRLLSSPGIGQKGEV